MTEPTVQEAGLLTPRKLIAQVLGFGIGIALLAWCIYLALRDGDWNQLAHANVWLLLGLLGCSLVSQVVNGVIFWVSIQPVQKLRLDHMILLNLVTSVLNYAPIRLGLISRVAYHVRVDEMKLLTVVAWIAALGVTMIMAIGACVGATLIRNELDLAWVGIMVALLAGGCLMTQAMMSHRLVGRYGRGVEQILNRPAPLWGAASLRLLDLGAFIGRMGFAAAILGLDLTMPQIVLLGLTALTVSLNPVGRLGFRELAVAFVATQLLSNELSEDQISGSMAQLALIESAGEALVAVPLGSLCLVWYRRRWLNAATRNSSD